MKVKGHSSTQPPPFSNAVRVNKVLCGETPATMASLPGSPHGASCSLLIQRSGSFGATFKDPVMPPLPITIQSSSLCFVFIRVRPFPQLLFIVSTFPVTASSSDALQSSYLSPLPRTPLFILQLLLVYLGNRLFALSANCFRGAPPPFLFTMYSLCDLL